jgi:CheY-like chemotaxis protein
MANKGWIKPEELEYIRKNCLAKTDEQLAKDLNRDMRTIKTARRRLGINKTHSGKIQSVDSTKNDALPIGQRLTEAQRKEFFKTHLTNSLYYENLKSQFTSQELDFYLEEWSGLCLQFEDILATEKRQIDEYIKAQIMGNRMLRSIKIAEEEIEKLTVEVENFRKSKDMATDDDAQEKDFILMNLLRTMHSQCQMMANDYQKNVDLKNKILADLNSRRRDRIEQIVKKGTTFLGIVQAFRDRNTRETQGRHIELLRLAKEKKRENWNKPMLFPDGTKDCILMDENANLNETSSNIIFKNFVENRDKKILVVDDDMKRCQFLSGLFKAHSVDFASNFDKARKKLDTEKYDLVMLDYDLGLGDKGDAIAKYIVDTDICKNSSFIVHSMNKLGAFDIYQIISNTRKAEVLSFAEIVSITGENNA